VRLPLSLFASTLLFTTPVDAGKEEAPKQDRVGIVFFEGEVTSDRVDDTIREMVVAKDQGAKAILLDINSPGGEVGAGIRLSKVIEIFGLGNIPVVCLVDTQASSMAFYILQSCTVRLMTDRSLLMAHEPSFSPQYAKSDELKQDAKILEKLGHAMNHHMARRLKISLAEFEQRVAGKDWFMTDEEALEVGAVDQVVQSLMEAREAMESIEGLREAHGQ
jgi:ATP-dependent protease ClpP protease subunit